jgi:hypothetical protein
MMAWYFSSCSILIENKWFAWSSLKGFEYPGGVEYLPGLASHRKRPLEAYQVFFFVFDLD